MNGDNTETQNSDSGLQNLEYLPDFELMYSQEDLKKISQELTEKDEQIFKEILELEKNNDGKSDLMKDLLEAAKKGTMQYLDAMTDTGDTFSHMKDQSGALDNEEIERSNKPAYKDVADKQRSRTMGEARLSPFDPNATQTTSCMSEKGRKIFVRELEAYAERTKSVIKITTENNPIHTSNEKENLESLSGLRSFRIGRPFETYPTDEVKKKYDEKVARDGQFMNQTKLAAWVRTDVNFPKVYDELMDRYGFPSRYAAKQWLKENHLTIHETSDGMIIIPQDVHNRSPHSGYCSNITALLKGNISRKEFNEKVVKEKIDYVRHEATQRGIRVARGIGMSAIKDVLKCSIVVICKETYSEFSETRENKFVDRMMRIFKSSWEHVKNKCSKIIKDLWKNIKGSIVSEILTALNDFLFGTFKNIFKIVRQMWGSIKGAFSIIFSKDKNISAEERIFEASKILSAGVVSLIGFSLNELIEKGLSSIGIPYASFIAECLSGLFAGIMSAIVIMLFDKFKKNFMTSSSAVQKLQLESQSLCVHSAQLSVSSLQINYKMVETYNFIGNVFHEIGNMRSRISENMVQSREKEQSLREETALQDTRHSKLEDLKIKYKEDKDF